MTTEQSSIPNTYTYRPKVDEPVVIREGFDSHFAGYDGVVTEVREDRSGPFALVRLNEPRPHARIAVLRFPFEALRPAGAP